MKTPKPYRVKSAYGMYRKGDIIFPTGMLRDELIMCGRIEPEPAPAPAPAPEPEHIDDMSDEEYKLFVETATVTGDVVENAVTAEAITATTPRRRGRHGR